MAVKITPEESEKLRKLGAIFVDVREVGEFKGGHIKGAINIPIGLIQFNSPDELPDKVTPIVVNCFSGIRSQKACQMFELLGYENVYDVGGVMNWPYEKEF